MTVRGQLAAATVALATVSAVLSAAVAASGAAWDPLSFDPAALLRTVAWALAFTALHCTAHFAALSTWKPNTGGGGAVEKKVWRIKFSNRVSAFVHAAVATAWTYHALHAIQSAQNSAQPSSFSASASFVGLPYDLPRDPSQWWLHGAAEFTLGYALYDFGYMSIHEPSFLFMSHHICMFFCFSPVIFFRTGFVILLLGTVIAEMTNPVMVPWSWAQENSERQDLSESDRASFYRIYRVLNTPLTLFYVFARGFVMPLAIVDVAHYLFVQGKATPLLACMWFYCFLGFLGSLMWIRGLLSSYIALNFGGGNKSSKPRSGAGSDVNAAPTNKKTQKGE